MLHLISCPLPFPGASLVAQMVKASAYNAGDLGSIPGLGRSPGEGNGNPLQYSCLENPMDGEPGGLQSMGSQSVCLLADCCLFSFFCFIASDYLLTDSFSHLTGTNVGPA